MACGWWTWRACGTRISVPAAVAAALGIAQVEGSSVLQSLAGVLARQQVLVVLDNCEQVAAAVAEVCEFLLLAADDVRILATSREPVGVAGEARVRLPSLTPKPGEDGDDAEAVALFADRARRVDPHFALTGATRQAVARLVERLDGMPLAIELAAARVESLGVEQLLEPSVTDSRFSAPPSEPSQPGTGPGGGGGLELRAAERSGKAGLPVAIGVPRTIHPGWRGASRRARR